MISLVKVKGKRVRVQGERKGEGLVFGTHYQRFTILLEGD